MECRYLPSGAPAYPPDEYVSPAVRTGVVLMAPPSAPDTKALLPEIVMDRPAITPAMVHTNAAVEDWDACAVTRWIAGHPFLAGLGLIAVYLLAAGRKAR